MLRIHVLACALLSAILSLPASAHITLEQGAAPVGAPYKAVFRVPHGCDGSSTIKLTVQIPDGVIAIKPMVKPGWQIEMTRGAYARSYGYFHGAKFDQGVKEVSWSGGHLPDAFYDEFVLSAFVAGELAAGTTLYFPVVQQCETGAHHWIEIPAADAPGVTHGDPAPALKLIPRN